jgi:hypothetical protein
MGGAETGQAKFEGESVRYMVCVYGFETKEEAEEARKKAQRDFCKWAEVIDEDAPRGEIKKWVMIKNIQEKMYSFQEFMKGDFKTGDQAEKRDEKKVNEVNPSQNSD